MRMEEAALRIVQAVHDAGENFSKAERSIAG